MSRDYMAKPCAQCPFRRDVRPFLRVARAEEIAYSASNPYTDFPCHKTLGHDDDDEDSGSVILATSLTCAGFLAMQINDSGREEPEGWEWPGDVYCDPGEMVDAYQAEADGKWAP